MKRIHTLILMLCLLLSLCLAGCAPAEETTAPPLLESCDHKDTDANLYCDLCEGYVLVELDFFAINDIHGKFSDSATQPGVDELTTYLASQEGNTIFLSSGDSWQGSSESNLTYGALMTEWMNGLGFVSMTLGNHEFDWGEEYVAQNAELADFPFLAINIYDRATDTRVDYCQSSVMIERAGVKIGIIGAIGDCYSSISGDKVEDIYFKTGSELTLLVKEESNRLRSQGADIIVYSIHDGYDRNMSSTLDVSASQMGSYYDVSLSSGFVDLVFEGHIHKHYTFRDPAGVYHLQGGGDNAGISHAEVFYNLATDSITSVEPEFISNRVYGSHAPHPSIETLLDKYADQIAIGSQILGHNDQYRTGDSLRQLIAQLYYEAGVERWGTEYDIVLGGGFISVRSPYNLDAGDVTYSQLQSLFPFDNELVLCSVRGSDLRAKFLETSNENYFIHLEDYGYSVWENLDPTAIYYLITDSYSSSYGPNQLTEIARFDAGVFARDLLADYIKAGYMTSGPVPEDYQLTSIPQINDICQAMTPGSTSKDSYFVLGTVAEVQSTKYGNLVIRDENGNELFIYGLYDRSGEIRYDSMENPPKAGDTVVLYGQLQHYVSPDGEVIYEMVRAKLVEIK